MSPCVTHFQPRQPYPYVPLSSNQRKSLRRGFIFPFYHHRLPTSNAPCARFRMRRRDIKIRNAQLTQVKALKQSFEQITTDTFGQIARLQVIFAQVAQVHQISVAYGLPQQEFFVEERPSSPVHVTFPHRSPPPKRSSEDIFLHRQYINSSDHGDHVYLEISSRPTSSLSVYSAASTVPPCQLYPSSPLLELIGLPPLPPVLPPETDTFHCVSMAEFRKRAWDPDRPHEEIANRNPFKPRRPANRKRSRTKRRKH